MSARIGSRSLMALPMAVLISTVLAAQGAPAAGSRFYADAASVLVEQGLALAAPSGPEAATFEVVPSPGVRNVRNEAQATTAPWVDSNAWRFQRGARQVSYVKLRAGTAPIAAAESFAFGVDAVLDPDPADVQELAGVLRFVKAQERPRLPAMANIGVIDDGTPAMGEIMNMLTRRNLLYRVVARPERGLDVIVQLGSAEFPSAAAANPSDFAARVRERLGDDKRFVRVYGTSTAIAHLTGNGSTARLYVLSYTRNRMQQEVRMRVRGRYRPVHFAAYGIEPGTALMDVQNPGDATEFLLPPFSTIAIVDLQAAR